MAGTCIDVFTTFYCPITVCVLTVIAISGRSVVTGRHALNSRHQTLGGRRAVPTVDDVHI